MAASAAGATRATGSPRPHEDRSEEGAAADAVDPADHADDQGQAGQGARGQLARGRRPVVCRGEGAQAQPRAERQQQGGDQEPEDVRAGEGEDAEGGAEDDAGQCAQHQTPGEVAAQGTVVTVAPQGAGPGDDVEQQIGRSDGRVGHAEDAQLDGEKEHGAGHAAWVPSRSRSAARQPARLALSSPPTSPLPASSPAQYRVSGGRWRDLQQDVHDGLLGGCPACLSA